ncbi:MAG: hypothetical protein JSS53_09485 [Proteobacteria bacterium]|nr:hypothetical protein [Pseudomonadota bacterium]
MKSKRYIVRDTGPNFKGCGDNAMFGIKAPKPNPTQEPDLNSLLSCDLATQKFLFTKYPDLLIEALKRSDFTTRYSSEFILAIALISAPNCEALINSKKWDNDPQMLTQLDERARFHAESQITTSYNLGTSKK